MAPGIPEGGFTISPTEDYLIFSIRDENNEKPTDLRIIYSPDDRQPYWRNRSQLYKYDMATGRVAATYVRRSFGQPGRHITRRPPIAHDRKA